MREDSLEGDVLVAIAGRHLSRYPGRHRCFCAWWLWSGQPYP
jgi:hypothetical protein